MFLIKQPALSWLVCSIYHRFSMRASKQEVIPAEFSDGQGCSQALQTLQSEKGAGPGRCSKS